MEVFSFLDGGGVGFWKTHSGGVELGLLYILGFSSSPKMIFWIVFDCSWEESFVGVGRKTGNFVSRFHLEREIKQGAESELEISEPKAHLESMPFIELLLKLWWYALGLYYIRLLTWNFHLIRLGRSWKVMEFTFQSCVWTLLWNLPNGFVYNRLHFGTSLRQPKYGKAYS